MDQFQTLSLLNLAMIQNGIFSVGIFFILWVPASVLVPSMRPYLPFFSVDKAQELVILASYPVRSA